MCKQEGEWTKGELRVVVGSFTIRPRRRKEEKEAKLAAMENKMKRKKSQGSFRFWGSQKGTFFFLFFAIACTASFTFPRIFFSRGSCYDVTFSPSPSVLRERETALHRSQIFLPLPPPLLARHDFYSVGWHHARDLSFPLSGRRTEETAPRFPNISKQVFAK